MSNIWTRAGLLLFLSAVITSCGTSYKAKIIETINKESAFQATQSAPDPANAAQNISKIMKGFSEYKSCLETLGRNKKIAPKEAADLLALDKSSGIKIDSTVASDVRMAKVYNAVTNKFCN
ncbi:MAG: hypothetical protein AAFR77_01695 [Cyanobacteria bacterium J06631_2]